MSENNFTLKLNFSGPSYDDSVANYCNYENYIGKFCLREGRRKKGRGGGRKGRMEGKCDSES